ncbi:MAG TPA: signal recognition particle-docking protein FtsY [Methylococcaceae bacterium]|nr:signal recognition particle-docking protein FtsY [Methylococcaceae bacterium]
MKNLIESMGWTAFFLALLALMLGVSMQEIGVGASCVGWVDCQPAWLEKTNLYSTIGLDTLILLLAGVSLGNRKFRGSASVAWMLVGLVGVQSGLILLAGEPGAKTVLRGGYEFSGLLMLVLLYRLCLRFGWNGEKPATLPGWGVRAWVSLGLLLTLVQVALGVGVDAAGSGLACPDFPTCYGRWWPELDYARVLRDAPEMTGEVAPGGAGQEAAQRVGIALHWLHRLGAALSFVVLGGLSMRLSSGAYGGRVSRTGVWLSFLLLVEISLGVAAIHWRLPVAVSVAHSAGAIALLLLLVRTATLLEHLPEFRHALLQPPVAHPHVPVEEELIPLPEVEEIPLTEAEEKAWKEGVAPRGIPLSLAQRLRSGLSRTRGGLAGFLASLSGRAKIDQTLVEEIETTLLMADVGVEATQLILCRLQEARREQPADAATVRQVLREEMLEMLRPCQAPLRPEAGSKPFVLLVVGVNGVGKTTTIGKLARRFQSDGHSVMLAAGDTFRAAAVEQLQVWGERNGIPVVAQHTGADSASVIYDAMQSAQARGIDVMIADTAGRLHTKSNLMEELRKIRRILGKLDSAAPHEVLLVLDAGTGQNALSQARLFHEAVQLTGIALTKLDGTAKGGMIFPLARALGLPIRFIGVGEGIEDLQDFDAERFVDALLETESA